MTVKELIERVNLLRMSVEDGEIPDCTLAEFENLEVLVRVELDDGTNAVGALFDVDIDAGCTDIEVLILDGRRAP